MSIHRKRRKCRKTGNSVLSKNYFLKHRLNGDSKPIEISLRTSDKRIAQQKAQEYVQAEERKRSGLYVTEQQRSDGAKSLQSLKDEYIQYLIDKGTQRDHYRKVDQRLRDGFAYLGWNSLGSIDKRMYQQWISSQHKWSKKTQQHYQTAFKAFCKWLWEEEYLNENPLDRVRGINGVAASAPPIAAFTEDEARVFLAECPQYRKDFYSLMIYTGLRGAEANRLRVDSVRTDEQNRYWIVLNRDQAKARRTEFLEVSVLLVPMIRRLTQGRDGSGKLLPRGRPSRKTFGLDLERAGIKKVRFDGSCITFHSLRKTFVTLITCITDSPAAIQRLARHTTPGLTEIRYTDRKALNHHDIVDELPDMFSHATQESDDISDNPENTTFSGAKNAA